MAKKVLTTIKLQAAWRPGQPGAAGRPGAGPARHQHHGVLQGVQRPDAASDNGTTIPVVITVYEDRSFTFVTKTPPAAVLIKQAIGIEKGSAEPQPRQGRQDHAGQVRAIAERSSPTSTRTTVDQAIEDHRRAPPARWAWRSWPDGQARQDTTSRPRAGRPRARVRARRGDRARQVAPSARSSTSPSRSTSAPGLNVRHADEQLRGTIALPNGLGKDVTVAVFAQGDKAREAEEAGADVVGAEDLAKRVEEGFTDFDVAIATPDIMPVVGRLGRILGPQGKMPNPKVGTVTMDVAKAVEESKAGKVEYRTDRTAIVHLNIGKTSFDERRLLENYAAVIDELIRAKPSAAKGRYLRSITLASTMGPGVKVDPSPYPRHPRGGARPPRPSPTTSEATGDRRRAPHRAAREARPRRPVNREQKAAAIAEIADEIKESEAVFAVDYRGISVTAGRRAARQAARRRRHASGSSRTR